ncbi:DUF4249 family protein [Spirosoma sp. HMF3257]|uniref:DUF4249 domain-containing protein n=1 Tax=Spirosoma telluris TaxID=2183553 RepID=A0A327NTC0_9BACT|nr:DUF4249 family protein [Spirosoma telluris]RAI77823.1 DUF4249 domain-containing protein [Spirosoma telluris]
MKTSFSVVHLFLWLLLVSAMPSCVDPEDLILRGTVDIIVVDGTITNLAEEQIIRLNRSKADPLTGRFGTRPVTKAVVEVVVDSSQVVPCHETVDGSYQLPSDFKGQIGHAYQLRFTLSDGTRYVSTQQVMQSVPSIDKASARFNPQSLSPPLGGFFRAGHDVFIDAQDPGDQHNYYRWDWTLYEPQKWCRTCAKGFYSVFNPIEVFPPGGFYKSGTESFEDCFYPAPRIGLPDGDYRYDYACRTQCWEILHNYTITVFDDQYTNGGPITSLKVAQIPFYQHAPCLADIRQLSLTKDAYRYFKLFQDQTQNTGGLADTPPTALIGNVHNVANLKEAVVGYFTASAVARKPLYIDRKDTDGFPFGKDPAGYSGVEGEELFFALNQRQPIPEPRPPYEIRIFIDGTPRPPTAICAPIDQRTPFQPEGWPN